MLSVRPVEGTASAGWLLLLAVVEHAVPGALVAGAWASDAEAGRLTDPAGAVWFVPDCGGEVSRVLLIQCPCNCAELTKYRDGVETFRRVSPQS